MVYAWMGFSTLAQRVKRGRDIRLYGIFRSIHCILKFWNFNFCLCTNLGKDRWVTRFALYIYMGDKRPNKYIVLASSFSQILSTSPNARSRDTDFFGTLLVVCLTFSFVLRVNPICFTCSIYWCIKLGDWALKSYPILGSTLDAYAIWLFLNTPLDHFWTIKYIGKKIIRGEINPKIY